MNLLYTVNEAFVPQLAASVASVCENSSPDDAIHFFVFCDKVSQTSKETLRSFLNKYSVEIDFIDIDGFMEAGCIDFDTQGWNEIVLSRLLLARFWSAIFNAFSILTQTQWSGGASRSSGTLRCTSTAA